MIHSQRNIESQVESMQQEALRYCAQGLTDKDHAKRDTFCEDSSRIVRDWLVCLKGYLRVNDSFEVRTNFTLIIKELGLY